MIKLLSCCGPTGLEGEEDMEPEKLRSHKLEDIVALKDRLLTHCFVPRHLFKTKKGKKAGLLYEHHFLVETLSHSYGKEQPSNKYDTTQVEVLKLKFYEFSTKFGLFSKREADTWTHTAKLTRTNICTIDSNSNKKYSLGEWSVEAEEKKSIMAYLSSGIYAVDDRDDYILQSQALERAKIFTSANYKRTYHMQHNNCEHFATASFGMLNGRGWSFQLRKAPKEGSYYRTATNRSPDSSLMTLDSSVQ